MKNHPSSPKRDSNLNLPVLGSLAQQETSALANYATEAGRLFQMGLEAEVITSSGRVEPHSFPAGRGSRPEQSVGRKLRSVSCASWRVEVVSQVKVPVEIGCEPELPSQPPLQLLDRT
uniref:Uncharacterized protein n=1 Tax=Timema douglasi TaxID=61478 RepID=A0A7R8VRS5_TIMDO|nr:unnamed protein product [Timema douglasi]